MCRFVCLSFVAVVLSIPFVYYSDPRHFDILVAGAALVAVLWTVWSMLSILFGGVQIVWRREHQEEKVVDSTIEEPIYLPPPRPRPQPQPRMQQTYPPVRGGYVSNQRYRGAPYEERIRALKSRFTTQSLKNPYYRPLEGAPVYTKGGYLDSSGTDFEEGYLDSSGTDFEEGYLDSSGTDFEDGYYQ